MLVGSCPRSGRHRGQLPPRGHVRGQDSQRRQACRSACEQANKFELVINLKDGEDSPGPTIPQSVLYRADKMIK